MQKQTAHPLWGQAFQLGAEDKETQKLMVEVRHTHSVYRYTVLYTVQDTVLYTVQDTVLYAVRGTVLYTVLYDKETQKLMVEVRRTQSVYSAT